MEVTAVNKKVYLFVAIFAWIALLTGLSYLVQGIGARGVAGVNYGRVVFPLLVMLLSLWLYKKRSEKS